MNKLQITKVSPQGYCGGVLQAIRKAKQCRQENPEAKITILGNLVHNAYVKKALESYHIQTIEDKQKTRLELLEDIDSGIVIFTAHGVSQKVKDRANQKGLIPIDASCPFVLQTQNIVNQYLDNGYSIFYIGKYKHPEAESIYSISDSVFLIQTENDIPNLQQDKIFVTNQTTMSIFEIQGLFNKIKKRYPQAIFHDEICNATRVRQQAILELEGKGYDCLVVVGDPSSNNTKKLADISKQAKIPNCILISDAQELKIEQFKDLTKIAVTSGASTPTYLTDQVIEWLEKYPNPTDKQIDLDKIL